MFWIPGSSWWAVCRWVLVDEIDGLVKLFGYRFFERIRGMLGRIAFVFSSRVELDSLFEDIGRGSPLANKLKIVWLGLLEPEAADVLIARGAGRFPPGGAELMRQWAGAHPFFLQLFGHYLCCSATGPEALAQFQTQAWPRLQVLWAVLTERDRTALLAGGVVERLGLKNRGPVTAEGRLFGEVLAAWLREEVL